MSSTRYNEHFIQFLSQMAQSEYAKGQQFKSRAYKKAQETIYNIDKNITCLKDIEGLPGIGKSILEKLEKLEKEIENRKSKKTFETLNEKPIEDPRIILTGVYGIGPKKANELVESGINTIEDLRKVQDTVLNDKQIIGLKYYEDVLKRIPRSEIVYYDKLLGKILIKTLNENGYEKDDAKYEIVGSYRRGALDSGDIDIIITTKKEKTEELFVKWIDQLIKEKIILEVLSRGPSKCLVMAKIPNSDTVRRVDFLFSPPEEFAFSILYFTGSKEFNTVMRGRALEFDLTLNEHGFHKMIVSEKGKKVKGEKFIKYFKDEKAIFDELKIGWKEPHERKSGADVIKL
jgi:DNA polymerase/3'-5' exonuclease PolX